MHSEKIRRLYTFVATYSNLTTATLALGLITFTVQDMRMAKPISRSSIFSTIPSRCAIFSIGRFKPFLILGGTAILHSLGFGYGLRLRTRRYLQ